MLLMHCGALQGIKIESLFLFIYRGALLFRRLPDETAAERHEGVC